MWRQRPKREFNIATSGQFRTLAMFNLYLVKIWQHYVQSGLCTEQPRKLYTIVVFVFAFVFVSVFVFVFVIQKAAGKTICNSFPTWQSGEATL